MSERGSEGGSAVVLLAGGNPQIAMGSGDRPVQDYIAAMPGWKMAVGRRLDQIIVASVPGVQKAVKWNSPLYGTDGETWFLSLRCYTKYLSVCFFRGSLLEPLPPKASKDPDVRYLDIFQSPALDEAQFADWVRQASQLTGQRL